VAILICPTCGERARFLQTGPLEFGWYCEQGHQTPADKLEEREA
jgi:hypothetical protein